MTVTDAELQAAVEECQATLDALLLTPDAAEQTGYDPRIIYKSYGVQPWDECAGCGRQSEVAPIPGCPVHDSEGRV